VCCAVRVSTPAIIADMIDVNPVGTAGASIG
jgi:hypothetical protein